MIAIWNGLPFFVQLAVLTMVGLGVGGLTNVILYACSNVLHLTNPWAPIEAKRPGESDSTENEAVGRARPGRLPLVGWWGLRQDAAIRGHAFWLGPMLVELGFAILLPVAYWLELSAGGLIPAVIDWAITLPLTLRYALLAVIGLALGAAANYLIFTQAHDPRPISPWAPPHEEAPPRRWSDRIPVIGWGGLRRESSLHGHGPWIRSGLIELAMAFALPLLYWFETQCGGLLPVTARLPATLAALQPATTLTFVGHGILLFLMVSATFIDFDEKTIPDIITIPGTLIALILSVVTVAIGATAFHGFMPTSLPVCAIAERVKPTTFDSPWFQMPVGVGPWASQTGLLAGLAIWSGWCFALADRRLSGVMLRRRGVAKMVDFFFAALFHHWTWKLLCVLWIVGMVAISICWGIGGDHWHGLFSSLVGLAVGGGTIWSIRVVASWAMQTEAMGFGDVTLMAMIGAFLGWQAATAAFFLAPFAAIAIVLIQYVITRDPHVPFGPYLCAGAALTVVGWDTVYNGWLACNFLTLWPMLKWLALVCLGLMGVMLFAMRMLRALLHRPDSE